jgi:hypothetical protein
VPFTFTVTRSSGVGTSEVNWSLSGSGIDSDDVQASSGLVSFTNGETSKIVTVLIKGDTMVEPSETFTVTLSNPQGATLGSTTSVTGTILNDDAPPATPTVAIAALSASKAEGNSGATEFTFLVSRDSTVGTSDVTWNFSGVGLNPAGPDDVQSTSDTVSFAHGEASKTITVLIKGDTTVEPNETFTVTLSNPQGATLGVAQAGGTITNDDAAPAAPMVSITADDDVKVEGNSTTTPFTFTIVRDSGEGTSTVGWTLTGSTDAFDFSSSSSGTVSFGANETSKTITVLVNGDTTVENNETFTVTLNSIDNATIDQSKASASSTILNDDFSQFTPSVFDIAMKDAVKYEGDSGTTQFTFTISRASTVGGASVRWRFLGDGEDPASRSDVKDYEGLVIFDDGEGSKEITVEVKGDLTNENDENFSVILMNAYGATIGASIADGLIRDDDNAPTNISLNASNAMELAATGSVVGTLSAQDPDAGSTFTYALLDSAGGRFRISGNQLLVDNGFLLDFEQGGHIPSRFK